MVVAGLHGSRVNVSDITGAAVGAAVGVVFVGAGLDGPVPLAAPDDEQAVTARSATSGSARAPITRPSMPGHGALTHYSRLRSGPRAVVAERQHSAGERQLLLE